MDHANMDYDQTILTQEETFRGLPGDRAPPLNFQLRIDHDEYPRGAIVRKIDFSPLVKATPFQKERLGRHTYKLMSILPSENPDTEEAKANGDSKVTFDDEQSPRVWGASRRPTRTVSTRQRSQSTKNKGSMSPLKSILKNGVKSKYQKDFSTQNSSEYTRNYSTQNSKVSTGPRMSLFQKFNEVPRNGAAQVGGSGDVTLEPSFTPAVFSYNSDIGLDYQQPRKRSSSRTPKPNSANRGKRKSAI